MLQALSAFDAQASDAPSENQCQRESDRDDPIAVALRAKRVAVKSARDALFLAVHGLIVASGESRRTPAERGGLSAYLCAC